MPALPTGTPSAFSFLHRPLAADAPTHLVVDARDHAAITQTPAPRRPRSWQRRLLGGVVGAAAGLFAGGYLGATIEGDDCHCDDPGLMGALIGAPIGTVAGAIAGALWLF